MTSPDWKGFAEFAEPVLGKLGSVVSDRSAKTFGLTCRSPEFLLTLIPNSKNLVKGKMKGPEFGGWRRALEVVELQACLHLETANVKRNYLLKFTVAIQSGHSGHCLPMYAP